MLRIGFPVIVKKTKEAIAVWVETEIPSSNETEKIIQWNNTLILPDPDRKYNAFDRAIKKISEFQNIDFRAPEGDKLIPIPNGGNTFRMDIEGGSYGLLMQLASQYQLGGKDRETKILISGSYAPEKGPLELVSDYQPGSTPDDSQNGLLLKWQLARKYPCALFLLKNDFANLGRLVKSHHNNFTSEFDCDTPKFSCLDEFISHFTEWSQKNNDCGRAYSLSQIQGFEQKATNWANILGNFFALKHITGSHGKQNFKSKKHNLPERPYLIGRRTQIEKIMAMLGDKDRNRQITINGAGGIGKTALALELAYRALELQADAHEPLFDYCIWTSAKQEEPRSGAIIPKEHISSAAGVMEKIWSFFRSIQPPRADNLREKVKELLSEHRCLLIIDNVETINAAEFPAISGFISDIPSPSKALITDGLYRDDLKSISLLHFEKKEAMEYIDSILEDAEIEWDIDVKSQIIEITGTHPYGIRLVVSALISGDDLERLKAEFGKTKTDNPLDYLFSKHFSRISEQARKILKTLSCLDPNKALSGERLKGVLEFETSNIVEACKELIRRSLLQKTNSCGAILKEQFNILPLTQRFALTQMLPDEQSDYTIKIITQLLKERERGERYPYRPSNETVHMVEENLELYLWGLDNAINLNIDQAYTLMRHLATPLTSLGYNGKRLEFGERIYKKAEASGNKQEMAENLIFNIAWMHLFWNEFPECENAVKKGLTLAREIHNRQLEGAAIMITGMLEKRKARDLKEKNGSVNADNEHFITAQTLLNEALAIFKDLDKQFYVVTLGTLASLDEEMGISKEKVKTMLLTALELAEDLPNPDELMVINCRRLSEFSLSQGDIDEAQMYNEKANKFGKNLKNHISVAYYKRISALIYEARGLAEDKAGRPDKAIVELESALREAEDAKELFIQYDGKWQSTTNLIKRINDRLDDLRVLSLS